MTEAEKTTPNAHRLAHGLEALASRHGAQSFAVYAYLVFDWRDRIRALFSEPDPVVDVEWSDEHDEIKIHLGGDVSPLRANDPPMQAGAVVRQLLAAPMRAAAGPMYACLSLEMPREGEVYSMILNVPIRSVDIRLDRKKQRVLIRFTCARRAQ